MNDIVTVEVTDDIALVIISNPPVNAINQKVRSGLMTAFQTVDQDNNVRAVVLKCAGRTFMAGADIKEFDEPIAEPGYHEVFRVIESCSKPVIAAMHGTALGAGLEAALACHYRCAVKNARMGLPEVSLGIIPGAGGSQRLPRLIGAKAALEFILGVVPVSATEAYKIGIIDRVIEEDLMEGTLEYVGSLLADGVGPRKVSEMLVDKSGYGEEFLVDARKLSARRLRGQNAPNLVIEAINNAVNLPFEEGIRKEKIIGDKALVSKEAKALRNIFFSEREIGKIPGISSDTKRMQINNVAILGSGTMGGGIAMNFANAGIPAVILDVSEAVLQRGIAVVRENYENTVKRGRLSKSDMVDRMELISGTTDYNAIAESDLVIEAVFEDIDLKKKVFKKIDGICKPEAIIATNTSTLNIDQIAAVTKRPEKIIGLHFFSPANVMKLLEIVRAEKTSPEVLATAIDTAKRIKKIGVVAGVCFGFIGNRMMAEGFHREADQMLLEGASPQQIDQVMYGFGFPMGPFAMHDMAGVDIMHSILKTTGKKENNREPYFNVLYQVGELGRFGQKTGSGFYRYDEGSRRPLHDPVTDALILQEAERLGIKRTTIENTEIEQRCMYSLINEGAKILEEGIAYRPGDIDVIWSYGYGFPRFRGGPMYMADQIGLETIYEAVMSYRDKFGDYWTPAPLLETLARDKKTFADWNIA
ncbi:MAG TPA: 3-hydroxyacyl-CoA dehydrogenase [Rhodospirillales bacterium]|nr:3-hydroxyacyl-CoA dehydrogenase [Rhodospirillales bacterium]